MQSPIKCTWFDIKGNKIHPKLKFEILLYKDFFIQDDMWQIL